MTFNKLLLAAIFSICVLFTGCSTHPEKTSGEKNPSSKSASNSDGEKNAVPASVLPAGPATPNPYLLNPPKVSDSVAASFRDAVAAIQQKNWAYAESVLTPLAAANPNLSGVQLNLGIAYRGKGDNEKAAEAFNRAITANSKNVDAYNQLAVLKREAGDFAGAELLYQKALNQWPFYPEGHKNIAILYDLYLGKPDQALPHYQAYQQLLPAPDKQVDSWVAEVQRRVSGGKDSKKNIDKKPESVEAK